ncbi:Thiamine transporter isoform D [Neolecta irregularis DAH-3]|uniref:Thiamine transporter isoform A n=1 Tax=Neolecta irregularis (strain DAH-3) TaxID=1198029 RepID=A0A1U7LWC1_NEOID|nr:Thiamine transporter isoform A [Neolecta irregularis DAH-3]OLL26916.1 Thiamine transporter isoform B [Neolecta irregularis DAH-3]OLL26917.1 Thiamine transporter isoform C [Neolecta irregularis DAH-3]OLL26918.1 Thiamine transporter isoform D [Neolecta irregularis DAH-3]|eukprot:OLL26915.1 Thiamine transporter isoform A [Neolecta irregularis DAH-3]
MLERGTVCVSAIWPSFAKIKNTLPESAHMTTVQLIGFTLFWFLSLPMLWIPPEKFKRPFAIVAVYVIIVMLAITGWSVGRAGGQAGKLLTQAAGITNQPDYARFTEKPQNQVIGQTLSLVVTGTLVSFLGLVTTANCQTIYGEIIWNPPDLMMKMMDDGKGGFWARVAVFFAAFGFALASMFENVSGNAFSGGFDLAGILPKYIDIHRVRLLFLFIRLIMQGAIITFIICWVVQPWQLINSATTFLNVLSSYSVFLAPLIGIMCCDYFIVRRQKIKLSDLYSPLHSIYWFRNGMNWRCVPAWIVGWALTLPGFIATVQPKFKVGVAFMRLFYLAFFIGNAVLGGVFYLLNCIFPPEGLGKIDEIDVYGTFTEKEAAKVGVVPLTRIGCITVTGEKADSMDRPLRDTKNPSVLEL